MALRVAKVDEYQFLICVKHGLWGSQRARFRNWVKGDLLVFLVDKHLAALAEVSGAPFVSSDIIWDNGAFPNRLPLRFTNIIAAEDRPPILGAARDALVNAWGDHYGLGIVNQQPIEGPGATAVADIVKAAKNSLPAILGSIEELLTQAKLKIGDSARRSYSTSRTHRPAPVVSEPEPEPIAVAEPVVAETETSAHTKSQSELIDLGMVTGCSVWVAANDRNRVCGGRPIAEGCLERLPSMGLNPEASRRISLIDVIWVRRGAPVCAFEVETSTSIYSGLLRMSDLLTVIPAINIKIYIVAPEERRDKVMSELARPTFRKIGLNDYCKFISTSELSKLLDRVKGLSGHVDPSVVDTIASELEDDDPEY